SVCDGEGGSDEATVTVTVGSCELENEEPDANNDAVSIDCNEAILIEVLANDTDADGDVLSICPSSITQPSGGFVEQVGSSILFTPDADFDGTTSFSYGACDGNGGTDITTVVVMIANCPDLEPAIDAVNDDYETQDNAALIMNVLANDDYDCSNPTLSILNQPSEGVVLLTGTQFTYIPQLGMEGTVSFEYEICCGSDCDSATVTIEVAEHGPCELEEMKIPSVITPNNDGINDLFLIEGAVDCPLNGDFEVQIFNQWGNQVFVAETYTRDQLWEGREGGAGVALPEGTYFYVITRTSEGQTKSVKGSVELRR
ncbi:Ig-like domain-containing protein, partial [Chitinophagales bacterium]|nr:Ig-like domain-containing protein [Chitinophagales bacterium]